MKINLTNNLISFKAKEKYLEIKGYVYYKDIVENLNKEDPKIIYNVLKNFKLFRIRELLIKEYLNIKQGAYITKKLLKNLKQKDINFIAIRNPYIKDLINEKRNYKELSNEIYNTDIVSLLIHDKNFLNDEIRDCLIKRIPKNYMLEAILNAEDCWKTKNNRISKKRFRYMINKLSKRDIIKVNMRLDKLLENTDYYEEMKEYITEKLPKKIKRKITENT